MKRFLKPAGITVSCLLDSYPSLADDLKTFATNDLQRLFAEAKGCLEKNKQAIGLKEMHVTARLDPDYEAILKRLNAEIDLFVARYTTTERN